MMEEEKYVSRNGVSRDLLHVVAKFGIANLRQYIQSARNPVELRDILTQAVKWLEDGTFQAVKDLNQDPKKRNVPGYQPFEKAWKQLIVISTMPAPKIKNRYQLVLDSVTFVEADIMRRLISGNFDVENVKIFYGIGEFATEQVTENKSPSEQSSSVSVEAAPTVRETLGGEREDAKAPDVVEVVVEEKPKKKRGRKKKTETQTETTDTK